jgi:hypothetical protein
VQLDGEHPRGLGGGEDVLGPAAGDQPAAVDQADAIAEARREVQVVGGEQGRAGAGSDP